MGRNAPLYSDEQRKAIIYAVCDLGLSARRAVEKAAAGELGIDPFEMPVSTAQNVVTDHVRRLEAGVPTVRVPAIDRLRAHRDRLMDDLDETRAKIEDLKKRGEPHHVETNRAADLVTKVAKAEAAVQGAASAAAHAAAAKTGLDQPGSASTSRDSDLAERLQRQLDAENTARPPLATEDGNGDTASRN